MRNAVCPRRASCPSGWIAEDARVVSESSFKAISVEKPTTWLVFSSGIDVEATRPWSDHRWVSASRRRTRFRRQLGYFSAAIG